MIGSLYPDDDEQLSGIISTPANNEIGKTLCAISNSNGNVPFTEEQLKECQCFGLLFLNDESIGYFFIIKELVVIRLDEEFNTDTIKQSAYIMIINNINSYYPNILDNNAHLCVKQKRILI